MSYAGEEERKGKKDGVCVLRVSRHTELLFYGLNA